MTKWEVTVEQKPLGKQQQQQTTKGSKPATNTVLTKDIGRTFPHPKKHSM